MSALIGVPPLTTLGYSNAVGTVSELITFSVRHRRNRQSHGLRFILTYSGPIRSDLVKTTEHDVEVR